MIHRIIPMSPFPLTVDTRVVMDYDWGTMQHGNVVPDMSPFVPYRLLESYGDLEFERIVFAKHDSFFRSRRDRGNDIVYPVMLKLVPRRRYQEISSFLSPTAISALMEDHALNDYSPVTSTNARMFKTIMRDAIEADLDISAASFFAARHSAAIECANLNSDGAYEAAINTGHEWHINHAADLMHLLELLADTMLVECVNNNDLVESLIAPQPRKMMERQFASNCIIEPANHQPMDGDIEPIHFGYYDPPSLVAMLDRLVDCTADEIKISHVCDGTSASVEYIDGEFHSQAFFHHEVVNLCMAVDEFCDQLDYHDFEILKNRYGEIIMTISDNTSRSRFACTTAVWCMLSHALLEPLENPSTSILKI